MEIINILFVTEDNEYAKAFTGCITEENPRMIFTVQGTDEYEPNGKTEVFDMILTDNKSVKAMEYIFLSEKREEDEKTHEKYEKNHEEYNKNHEAVKILYKYDTVRNIANQLVLFYCIKTGRKIYKPKLQKSEMIFFCSAEGGTGKTSVALGLAQELTRFHSKKVLYINYEEFESTNKYFVGESEKTITNYLYYMEKNKIEKNKAEENKMGKNKTGNIPVDSFTVCNEYGVAAFSASEGKNQLKNLNVEELSLFIDEIQKNGDFNYIFIDNDTCLGEGNLWLMSVCDKICSVEKHGNIIKQVGFFKYLRYYFGEQIFDKIITVSNFFKFKEYENVNMEEKIFIEYDSDSFNNYENENNKNYENMININIDRDFGLGIKQLSTKLTLNLQ